MPEAFTAEGRAAIRDRVATRSAHRARGSRMPAGSPPTRSASATRSCCRAAAMTCARAWPSMAIACARRRSARSCAAAAAPSASRCGSTAARRAVGAKWLELRPERPGQVCCSQVCIQPGLPHSPVPQPQSGRKAALHIPVTLPYINGPLTLHCSTKEVEERRRERPSITNGMASPRAQCGFPSAELLSAVAVVAGRTPSRPSSSSA